MKNLIWVVILQLATILFCGGQVLQHQYTFYNSSNSVLSDNTIRSITLAPDSTLWVATDWGLVIIADTGWTLLQTTNSGLPGDDLKAIAFDHAGRPWVTTGQHGVGFLADTGWVTYNMANSPIPNNDVKAIAFDTSGQAWLGTVGGIACVCDTGWAIYNGNNTPLTVNNIGSIAVDDTNAIWFGTLNGGLAKFHAGNWVTYTRWNSALPDNTIHDIHIAPNGLLWLATPAAGLVLFNGASFQALNTQNSSIGSNSLFGLAFDTAQVAYMVTIDKGLIRYRGSNKFTQFSSDTNADVNGQYLIQDQLLSLAIDKNHAIWLGTSNMGLVSVKFSWVDTSTAIFEPSSKLADLATVYPNPFTELLYINLNVAEASITVYNQQGQLLSQQIASGPKQKIPFGNLPKGIYYVVIQSAQKVQTEKVIQF